MLRVAASGGRGSTVGVGAADELDGRHPSGALVVCRPEQQPGDGLGVAGWEGGDELAGDGARILIDPDRAAAVDAFLFSRSVEEVSVGSDELPLPLAFDLLAGVDLRSLAQQGEDRVLICRGCGGLFRGDGRYRPRKEHKQEGGDEKMEIRTSVSHGGGLNRVTGRIFHFSADYFGGDVSSIRQREAALACLVRVRLSVEVTSS